MLDVNGYVAEASVDNFFIVTDRALLTPPTATNLKGVTRETRARDCAASSGSRRRKSRSRCSTSGPRRKRSSAGPAAEVVPVVSVDDRAIGGRRDRPGDRTDHGRVPRARARRRARRSIKSQLQRASRRRMIGVSGCKVDELGLRDGEIALAPRYCRNAVERPHHRLSRDPRHDAAPQSAGPSTARGG